MRILIQRVTEASVEISGVEKSRISKGLLVFVGIETEDTVEDINYLINKIINLRIFEDDNRVMNNSILDIKGEVLIISQFTLHAQTRKGNRPSYIKAAKPDVSIPLYNQFINNLQSKSGLTIKTGEFGADMKVSLINDGPVTIWIDSKDK